MNETYKANLEIRKYLEKQNFQKFYMYARGNSLKLREIVVATEWLPLKEEIEKIKKIVKKAVLLAYPNAKTSLVGELPGDLHFFINH